MTPPKFVLQLSAAKATSLLTIDHALAKKKFNDYDISQRLERLTSFDEFIFNRKRSFIENLFQSEFKMNNSICQTKSSNNNWQKLFVLSIGGVSKNRQECQVTERFLNRPRKVLTPTLQFSQPVQFSNTIKPICLPVDSSIENINAGLVVRNELVHEVSISNSF